VADGLTPHADTCVETAEHGRKAEPRLERILAECERRLDAGENPTAAEIESLRALLHEARPADERPSGAVGGRHAWPAEVARDLPLRENGAESPVVGVDIHHLGDLLGSLARLCHKINNPLTSVMGRAQMLQLTLGTTADEKTTKSVRVIEESSRRVAALVQELANLVCKGRKEFVEHYDSRSGSR